MRVVIVDQHAAMRDALKRTFIQEPDITVVGEGSTARQAVKLVRKLQPDVVMMGMFTSGMDATYATRLIRLVYPKVRVVGVVLPENIEAMAHVGAVGCVSRTEYAPEALLETIRNDRPRVALSVEAPQTPAVV